MNRVITSSVLLILCVLNSSCSYSVIFALVNESNKTIEIEYTILEKNDYTSPYQTDSLSSALAPAKVPLLVWQRNVRHDEWVPVPQEQYSFDPRTGTVRFKLAPREAVRILTASGSILSPEGYKQFPVTKLEIRGEAGRMALEGPQLFKQFRKKDSGDYLIAYRGLADSEY